MNKLVLAIQDITMRFGGLLALQNVSCNVHEGELFSVIGPNGSGKSTLFNVITGVYKPQKGKVELNGNDITGKSPFVINHSGLARTFQNPRLFNGLTVLENVLIPLMTLDRNPLFIEVLNKNSQEKSLKEIVPIAKRALETTGLLSKANVQCSMLSYGDQKRLEIARCCVVNPQVLMLDEPVAGLNITERGEMKELIRNLHESGMTVLLIEHDMKIVMDISDRIMVLNYGQPIAFGKPYEIANNEDVIHAYLGIEEEADEHS